MKTCVILLALLLSALSLPAQDRSDVFSDDFRSYPDGSDGGPAWHVVKGNWQVVGGRYEQLSTEYDCASMLDRYMESAFELEVVFEHLGGDPGVGLLFASRRVDETAFAEMARFDGGTTCLAGYFQAGEFTATASTQSALLAPGARHTLTLRVTPASRTWTLLLDGAPVFDRPLARRYAGGYVGLQSSAGTVRFLRVRLRAIPGEVPAAHDWVRRLALSPDGRIVYPNDRTGEILVAGPGGAPAAPAGASLRTLLGSPAAVAFLDDGAMAVADRAKSRLLLFSPAPGGWRASAGWKGSSPGALSDPSALAAGPARTIFAVERGNDRVQVFDDSLRSVSIFGGGRLKRPSDIAIEGERVYVLNAGLSQVEIYHWDGTKAEWLRSVPFGGGDGRGLAVRHDTIYLSVVNEVRAYDGDGRRLRTLTGRSIGGLFPQGLAFDRAGRLIIADYVGGRIVVTDALLADPSPEVRPAAGDASAAVVRWTTLSPRPGALLLAEEIPGAPGRTAVDPRASTRHEVTLRGLPPASVVHFRISPALETWPPADPAGGYSLTTPTGPERKDYARLRMAAVIFSNITDEKAPPPPGTARAPVAQEELSRIREQILDGVRFYWMQSAMRLFIDVDIVVVDEPLARADVYGGEWWYPPKEDVLRRVLADRQRDVASYQSVLYLTCTQAFDSAAGTLVLAGKGGGFTSGVGTGKGYGISWWDVTKKDHNAGNNWLMVHEFNHQLDDIFMASGYPEYWFNHISPTIGTAGPFGEHFDANAHILRIVPDAEWSDLRYTTREGARDADADGIPDDAPALPMDERRLGSDPGREDTDGDGLSDLAELRASNWITEGWGETYGGAQTFPNLASRDTDADGAGDADDPFPCSPARPLVFRAGEDPDGRSNFFGRLDDARVRAVVSAWWDDSSFTVRCDMDRLLPVKLLLDAGGDGWFLGRGNYLLTLTPSPAGGLGTTAQIFNATDPDQWPFMDKILGESVRLRASLDSADGSYRITVTVPKSDHLGLRCRDGEMVGLLVGFLAPFGDGGAMRYVDLFEPNRFLSVKLSGRR